MTSPGTRVFAYNKDGKVHVVLAAPSCDFQASAQISALDALVLSSALAAMAFEAMFGALRAGMPEPRPAGDPAPGANARPKSAVPDAPSNVTPLKPNGGSAA